MLSPACNRSVLPSVNQRHPPGPITASIDVSLNHLGARRHKSVTILTGEFPQSCAVVHLSLVLLRGVNSVSANNLQHGFAAPLLWRIPQRNPLHTDCTCRNRCATQPLCFCLVAFLSTVMISGSGMSETCSQHVMSLPWERTCQSFSFTRFLHACSSHRIYFIVPCPFLM